MHHTHTETEIRTRTCAMVMTSYVSNARERQRQSDPYDNVVITTNLPPSFPRPHSPFSQRLHSYYTRAVARRSAISPWTAYNHCPRLRSNKSGRKTARQSAHDARPNQGHKIKYLFRRPWLKSSDVKLPKSAETVQQSFALELGWRNADNHGHGTPDNAELENEKK